jgi:hypothetical protein
MGPSSAVLKMAIQTLFDVEGNKSTGGSDVAGRGKGWDRVCAIRFFCGARGAALRSRAPQPRQNPSVSWEVEPHSSQNGIF